MHEEGIRYMQEAFARHTGERAPAKVLDVGASGRRRWNRTIWEGAG